MLHGGLLTFDFSSVILWARQTDKKESPVHDGENQVDLLNPRSSALATRH